MTRDELAEKVMRRDVWCGKGTGCGASVSIGNCSDVA